VIRNSPVGALLRSCHPEPTLAVTAVMAALAATAGRGVGGTVAVAAAVLAGQLSVGWCNDYLDADRDRAVGRPDKPVADGSASRRVVGIAALTALALVVPLSLLSGWRAALSHLVGVAAAWAYDLGVKSSVWSVIPYVVAFGLLPGLVVFGLPGHPWPPVWLVVAGALMGAGAHFANVLPDLASDAATGIRGLPHRLGSLGSSSAAGILLLGATCCVVAGTGTFPAAAAAAVLVAIGAVLAIGLFRTRTHPLSRAPFRVVLGLAGANVLLLVAAGSAIA
jgi:4-hydroxybenzoate polyprenyltransferase